MPVKRVRPAKAADISSLKGTDTEGKEYNSVSDLWKAELGADGSAVDETKREQWYKKGVDYWMNVDATVDGVLGGFGKVSNVDVKGSAEFFKLLKRVNFDGAAADCGGGVGRTSEHLLSPLFNEVDLIEPTPKFVEKAKELMKDNTKMARYYQCGLEAWTPEKGRYTMIWCQWVLPHLTDDDLVAFFKRCVPALAAGGIIGVKENNSSDGFIMDKEDTSVTRTDAQFKHIFKLAGLKLFAEKLQSGFPRELLPVRMYALIPDPKYWTADRRGGCRCCSY
jgi:protein N-terminal methyltransferase